MPRDVSSSLQKTLLQHGDRHPTLGVTISEAYLVGG